MRRRSVRSGPLAWGVWLLAVWLLALGTAQAEIPGILLEDFGGFPHAWKVKDDDPRVTEVYRVLSETAGPYLAANAGPKPGLRIFKYVAWDTEAFPVVSWKWRLKSFPSDKRRSIAFYVSLYRDAFGIPTIVKYLWSTQEPVGTVRSGGFFGATEIVIQSGSPPDPDGWITARVDAAADFERLYGQPPSPKGVGIGVRVGMGLEADIAEVRVEPRTATEPAQ